MKLIYYFGSNNGGEIVYYLKKSDLVVAVEAKSTLAVPIKIRYQPEIEKNRLELESSFLTFD
jgi:hypothetical protein